MEAADFEEAPFQPADWIFHGTLLVGPPRPAELYAEAVVDGYVGDLAAAEETDTRWKQQEAAPLDSSMQQRVVYLIRDFPAAWNHPKTSRRETRRMLQLLIQDVTVTRDDDIMLQINWKGGALAELHVPLPKNTYEARRTPQDIVDTIAGLTAHHTDQQIADTLNSQGRVSGTGLRFTRQRIRKIRAEKNIPGYTDHLRNAGMLTFQELMARFGITVAGLIRLRKSGAIRTVRTNQRKYLYEPPERGSAPLAEAQKCPETRALPAAQS